VKAALGKVKGIKSVEVDVSKTQAMVSFHKEGKASLNDVLTAIKKETTFKPSAL
jgi:copper chaperone CopZ